jgi:hypothetical protein
MDVNKQNFLEVLPVEVLFIEDLFDNVKRAFVHSAHGTFPKPLTRISRKDRRERRVNI